MSTNSETSYLDTKYQKTEKFTNFSAKLSLLFQKSEIRNNSQCILKSNCEKSENQFSVNRNQKSQIPKTGIRNCKSEIRNRKSEIGNRRSEIGDRKSEIGNRKSEIGNRKSEIENRKSEIGKRKTENGNQKSEIRDAYHSTQRFEMGTNGTEISCEEFQKIWKLLNINFRKANHSTKNSRNSGMKVKWNGICRKKFSKIWVYLTRLSSFSEIM